MTTSPEERAGYIAGLRQLADVLEQHPDLPLPYQGHRTEMTFYYLSDGDARERMAAAARALPCPSWRKGTREDSEYGDYLDLHGQLAGLKLCLTAYRDAVCTRRVVGTEDREVEEVVTPAVTRTVVKPVEVVEWDCGSVLGGGR